MKQYLLLIIILSFSKQINAQIEIEFYTNYGYQADYEANKMYNMDGEQFYWYFNVDLKNTIYKPNNPENVIEYNATGYSYRKDYYNRTNTKMSIDRVKIITYQNGTVSTIFYPSKVHETTSMTLTKEDGAFKLLICTKAEKEVCKQVYIHSSNRFEDENYISKKPSQVIK